MVHRLNGRGGGGYEAEEASKYILCNNVYKYLTLNYADATGHLGETHYFNVPIRGLLMKSDGTVGEYTRAFPILVVNSFYDRANHLARMGAFPLTLDPNYTER